MLVNPYYCVIWSPSERTELNFLSRASDYAGKDSHGSKVSHSLLSMAFTSNYTLRPVTLLRSPDLLHGLNDSILGLSVLKNHPIVLTTLRRFTSHYDAKYFREISLWASSNLPELSFQRLD